MKNQPVLSLTMRCAPRLFCLLIISGMFIGCGAAKDLMKTLDKSLSTRYAEADSAGGKVHLVVQTGHTSPIHAVAISSNGKMIASASEVIKLLDVSTGKEIRTIIPSPKHSGIRDWFSQGNVTINSLAISPDGNLIAGGIESGVVKLWDAHTGREIHTLYTSLNVVYDWVGCVAFSPDGKIVASGGDMIKLWRVDTGKEIRTIKKFFGTAEWVRSISFSPDSKLIAAGTKDKKIGLWQVDSGKKFRTLKGHSAPINAVAFSPDGVHLASAGKDGALKIWDFAAGKELMTLRGHARSIPSLAYGPDGKVLASSADKTIKLWHVATGTELRTLVGHTDRISSVAFSPDGQMLVSGSHDRSVRLWDSRTGNELLAYAGSPVMSARAACSPDGKLLASAGANSTVVIWDLSAGKINRVLSGHSGEIFSIAFHPKGGLLASGGADATVRLWDLRTGQPFHTLTGHGQTVSSVAFSPDGELLASGSHDRTIKLWRTETGRELRTLRGHSGPVHAVAFKPGGRMLASGSRDKTIRLWKVSNGKRLETLKSGKDVDDVTIHSLAFSPDGRFLASGGGELDGGDTDVGWTSVWDVNKKQQHHLLAGLGKDPVLAVAFSPYGTVLASGSHDRTITLQRDLESFPRKNPDMHEALGAVIAGIGMVKQKGRAVTLVGHASSVNSLAFGADGKILVSGSTDGRVKLWELARDREIASFIAIDEENYVIATPDHYYAAPKSATNKIAFYIDDQVFPFEQFDLRLNRPDIVLERLGHAPQELLAAYQKAYEKRLRKMNFTEEMLGEDFHLPEIAITSQNLPIATEQKMLTLDISARDSIYRLDRLNVFVNDVPVYGMRGIDLRDRQVSTLEREVNLELSAGANKIQVSVHNEKGVESLRETLEINYTGAVARPDLYVVAIGVSDYLDDDYDLTYASKDARDLITFLQQRKAEFAEIRVLPFLDQAATKESILRAREFLLASRVDDEVILFAAGHGLLDDNLDYYFATTDIDFDEPSRSGLPYETIEGLLDGIPARKKLLLMDTCHSGELDKEEIELVASNTFNEGTVKSRSFRGFKAVKKDKSLGLHNSFQLLQELFADLRRGSGAMVISSASGVEFALESPEWQNGVFTYAILEGLKTMNADGNKDGEVWVSELRDYVIKKVQKLTNGQQTPTSRRENLEFDFRVY